MPIIPVLLLPKKSGSSNIIGIYPEKNKSFVIGSKG
jgi:hypothetical protein